MQQYKQGYAASSAFTDRRKRRDAQSAAFRNFIRRCRNTGCKKCFSYPGFPVKKVFGGNDSSGQGIYSH